MPGTARFRPGKILVLFWLDNLLLALQGEYHVKNGQQQGLLLRQLVEGPVFRASPNSPVRLPKVICFDQPGSPCDRRAVWQLTELETA